MSFYYVDVKTLLSMVIAIDDVNYFHYDFSRYITLDDIVKHSFYDYNENMD